MRSFLAIASPILALFQTAISAPSHYDPVPYDQAPSYYPGAPWSFPTPANGRKMCRVAAAENGGNSVPNILKAFRACGKNGKVIFQDTTYHIDSVMEITGLSNVEIDIRGTLLWSNDISYWLANSLPMGYQSQSTAFIFGGDKIHMYSSNGKGTFNGNGQVWYERYGTISNYPRRPHQITFNGLTDSVIEGIKFLQSQMWTMTLIHSSKVLLQDIYVNNTNFKNNAYLNNLNTDGANTIYASDITFARWIIDNGDDNIAFKANSTNVLVEDGSFYRSTGLAFGSIGQFAGQHEIIEDIVVRNIAAYDNKYFAYVKTWTGVVQGTPPNGGGAGLGYLRNVSLSNSMAQNSLQAFYITQCNSYSGFTGQCDTSKFQISDFSIDTVAGTLQTDVVASMQCSGAAPCTGISIRDVVFTANTGATAKQYLCSNVEDPDGFECTGKAPQT